MNKNKFLYVAALFGMMVLVSCSSHDSAKNVTVTSEQSGAESQAAADIVSKPLTLLQSNDGWSYGAAGAKGCYFVSAAVRSDDSTSLMYCDYDTMQQLLLCSQPNCAHNTAACNGYLPYSAGGIVPEIVGQNLVLFYPGNVHAEENATLPRIETMGLDGSDRTETITFAANQEFLRPMVTDGDFIYACMWETSDNSMESFLVRIDPTAGTCEKMFSMDSTWIKGVVGDKLLLKSTSGDNSEWFTYDPVTGEQAVLYTESSSVLQPAAVYGQTLVYQKGDHFHLLDLSTGQDTELAGYTVPDQAVSYVNLYYADDGKLLFEQCSNAGADSQYADGFYVLESDKEPSPWTLTYSLYDKDTACAVVAAKDADTYLVAAGVQDTAAVQADDGASKYVSTGERRYALISKADYWSGNANYRDFEKIG